MAAIVLKRRFGEFSLPAGQSITGGQLVMGAAGPITRTVTDGVTNSTTAVTSATAAFTQADVGDAISGAGIPAGTVIVQVTSATAATLSQAATATATGVTFTITVPADPDANPDGSNDVVYVATANSTVVLGVAMHDALPFGSILGANPILAVPINDRLTIGAHGEFLVTYAANATVGQALVAAANGQVTPSTPGTSQPEQIVGYCTQSTSAGNVGRAYIGRL